MYEPIESLTRRRFLSEMGLGFGSVALATMLEGEANGAPLVTPLPKAKNVIWLFMIGGASHLETFDPKPALSKFAGKTIEETPLAAC